MEKKNNLENKKVYYKNYNPLDPQYFISSRSGRQMILGEIERSKPKVHAKESINKDTKRYM